ncbi:MAG: DUF4177 domain-containing protein [Hellea sp.]|nr:DUF4177 domain-containing protein [Hellea sp.]
MDCKWQYKIVKIGKGAFKSDKTKIAEMEEALNRLGLERWELVNIQDREFATAAYLKRRV